MNRVIIIPWEFAPDGSIVKSEDATNGFRVLRSGLVFDF